MKIAQLKAVVLNIYLVIASNVNKVMIRCEDCDMSMTLKKYQSHLKKHDKNLFCTMCRTKIPFSSFRAHAKIHYLQSLYDFGRYADDIQTKKLLLNEECAPLCIFGKQPMIMEKQGNL